MRHDDRVDPIPTLTLRLKGRECSLTAVSALGVLARPYDDARMMSAPFSAMAITVALILPDGTKAVAAFTAVVRRGIRAVSDV